MISYHYLSKITCIKCFLLFFTDILSLLIQHHLYKMKVEKISTRALSTTPGFVTIIWNCNSGNQRNLIICATGMVFRKYHLYSSLPMYTDDQLATHPQALRGFERSRRKGREGDHWSLGLLHQYKETQYSTSGIQKKRFVRLCV